MADDPCETLNGWQTCVQIFPFQDSVAYAFHLMLSSWRCFE